MRILMILAAALAVAGGMAGTARAAIHTETVEYKQGDAVLEGYLAYDDARAGKRPGVLVVHEWTGLGPYVKSRAEALAELGYVAFGADIYGKGVRPASGPRRRGGGRQVQGRPGPAARPGAGRAGAAAEQPAGGPGPHRRHRLLLRRHDGAGAGPQRRRRGRRGQLPRRAGHAHAAGRQEHQGQGAGAARRGRPVRARRRRCRRSRRRCGRAGWTGSWSSTAAPSTASPTRRPASDPSKGAAYNAAADRRSWEAMRLFFDEIFGSNRAFDAVIERRENVDSGFRSRNHRLIRANRGNGGDERLGLISALQSPSRRGGRPGFQESFLRSRSSRWRGWTLPRAFRRLLLTKGYSFSSSVSSAFIRFRFMSATPQAGQQQQTTGKALSRAKATMSDSGT